jgi:hypothetical protein
LAYVTAVPLNLQVVCQGEKVDIGFGQNLEVAGPPREVGDKLDRFGTGVSELKEGRQSRLKP